VPLSVRGEASWVTSWPGPRPTSVPSGILIIQPFGHKFTIHQHYRQTDRTGQRYRSIGRTVTCNGRPKTVILVYLDHVRKKRLNTGESRPDLGLFRPSGRSLDTPSPVHPHSQTGHCDALVQLKRHPFNGHFSGTTCTSRDRKG